MPSNFLDYITIEGFKSIACMPRLALRPINVVIGANGSGKSNSIGVFAFLHEIREGRRREYVTVAGGAEKVLHFGSKTTEEIYVDLSFGSGVNRYELRLDPTLLLDHFEPPSSSTARRYPHVALRQDRDRESLAPSKPIEALDPSYQQPLFGVHAVLEIGLSRIRAECRYFCDEDAGVAALPASDG
jgi:predicted ATPase